MTLSRPYKRIARPFHSPEGLYVGGCIDKSYLALNDYAPVRVTAIRGCHAIESDLKLRFEFVEPHDYQLDTFSIRLHEIVFLRAATEFEGNGKAIPKAHEYSRGRSGDEKWNLSDDRKH